MRVVAFLLLFFIPTVLFCQSNIVGLKHYERKKEFQQLLFVGGEYNSQLFDIRFPDSIYDRASIRIKKARFSGVKTKNLKLHMEDSYYTLVKLNFRGKKNLEKVNEWINNSKSLSKPKVNVKQLFELEDGTQVEIMLLKLPFGKYQLTMRNKAFETNLLLQ